MSQDNIEVIQLRIKEQQAELESANSAIEELVKAEAPEKKITRAQNRADKIVAQIAASQDQLDKAEEALAASEQQAAEVNEEKATKTKNHKKKESDSQQAKQEKTKKKKKESNVASGAKVGDHMTVQQCIVWQRKMEQLAKEEAEADSE